MWSISKHTLNCSTLHSSYTVGVYLQAPTWWPFAYYIVNRTTSPSTRIGLCTSPTFSCCHYLDESLVNCEQESSQRALPVTDIPTFPGNSSKYFSRRPVRIMWTRRIFWTTFYFTANVKTLHNLTPNLYNNIRVPYALSYLRIFAQKSHGL